MARFFARLSEDMAGGPATAETDDALAVVAALVRSVTPRIAEQLAGTLGWSQERVAAALRETEAHLPAPGSG